MSEYEFALGLMALMGGFVLALLLINVWMHWTGGDR